MDHHRSTPRSIAAACLVVALAMGGIGFYRALDELRDTATAPPPPLTEVEVAEMRLGGIRDALPRSGTIGYVTDAPDYAGFIERFYLAQFSLAPLIVVPSADLPVVIGDFRSGGPLPVPPPVTRLRLAREFGGGVVLFRVAK